MKKPVALILSLFLTAGTAIADTPKDSDPQATKPAAAAKPKASKKVDKSAEIASQIEELRKSMQSQQEQIQQLKNELARRDQQITEAHNAAAAADSKASEAAAKAAEATTASAEAKLAATSATSEVSDFKLGSEALKSAVQDTQKKIIAAESPSAIHYKGINITPGGFIDVVSVFRNRAVSGDINTPLTGIPYPGNSLAKVSENNFSGRHSRLSLLVEGKLASAKIGGYYEGDFLGAGTTSNNRQSNSYVFRQRQAFAYVNFDNGLSFSGGQMWTLAAENKKGIVNRQEVPPMVIDPQYSVGWTWARQYGFRVVKSLAKDKLTVAMSVEGPQTTFGGRGFSTFTPATGNPSQNFFINAPGAGGGLFNAFDATGYSVNKAPDLIFKAALDPGWGHYELLAILSQFRNRIYPCAVVSPAATNASGTVVLNGPALTGTTTGLTCTNTSPSAAGAFNNSRTGGGFGASFTVPLFKKKVDFGIKAVAGDGIGRYGSAQLADATFRPDGTMALIRGEQSLARLEYHASPKLDIYAYVGNEYAWRAAYVGYQTDSVATSQIVTACTVNTTTCPSGFNLTTITTHTTSKSKIGGYGSPFANNSGCSTETQPSGSSTPGTGGTCAGDIRNILEGSLGFWHKFYQGPKGGLRWGIQYSYLTKSGWSGNNSSPTATTTPLGISPKAVDNMLITSFRYYLP
jgi:hypothetical protein